jgi:hypothetical protein
LLTDRKTELWVLSGPNWKLPVRVIWHDAIGDVRLGAGIALLKKQVTIGGARLRQLCERESNGSFFILRHVLERNAQRSMTTDPEDLVEWGVPRQSEPEGPPVQNEFIDRYCASPYAAVKDPLMADYIWVSFCKFMLHWLMVENRPVHIGFAELVALQARENWMQVLAKTEMEKCPAETRYRPNIDSMIKRGVAEFAAGDFMVGWNGESCVWTLNVRTTKDWDSMAVRLERERMKARSNRYYHSVYDQMLRQLPELLATYRQYLAKAALPALKLFKSVQGSRYANAKAIVAKPIPPHSPFLDRATLSPADETVRARPNVASEDEILQSLSALRPPGESVREDFESGGSGI